MPEINEIEDLPRSEFISKYLAFNRPVKIKNLGGTDRLVDWTIENLVAKNGHQKVNVEHYPDGQRSSAFTYREMTLAEYVDLVTGSEDAQKHFFLAERPLEQMFPVHSNEYQLPDFVDANSSRRTVGFFGVNTFSTCHYHKLQTQAVITQVIGKKRLVMFQPKDMRHLELHPWYSARPNHSTIPFDQDEMEQLTAQYPRLARTNPEVVELSEGESLFIPAHWMHTAEGIGSSLSITTFWGENSKRAYRRGYYRDVASACTKSGMVFAASMGHRLGLDKLMVATAVRLGVIKKNESDAVLEYLAEFGTRRPNELKT
ncbi:MAG: cupin-like domain-containing protein [Planctomycetota bacterium]